MLQDTLRKALAEGKDRQRKRKLEKERKKRRSQKYGRVKIKHSRKGMKSCIMAFCAAFLLILIFSASYVEKGNVNIFIGFAGLLALAAASSGVVWAFLGFKERERNYITCKVGMGVNGVFLLGLIIIFLRGLM